MWTTAHLRPRSAFVHQGVLSAGWPFRVMLLARRAEERRDDDKAARSVKNKDRARSLPMLAVPGWLEKHRLPNATPVVSALKKIARVRLDAKRSAIPARQAMI